MCISLYDRWISLFNHLRYFRIVASCHVMSCQFRTLRTELSMFAASLTDVMEATIQGWKMCRKREHIPHLSESSSTLVNRYDTNALAEEKNGGNTRLASARSHVSIIRPMTCHICMFCWVEQYSLDLAESFPLRMCPIIAPRTPSHRWFPISIHFFSVVPGVEVVRGFYRPLVACWLVSQHALWKRLSAFYQQFVGWSRHLQYFPETLNSGRIPL